MTNTFALVVTVLAGGYVLLATSGKRGEAVWPLVLFAFMYLLVHFYVPAVKGATDYLRYGIAFETRDFDRAGAYALLFLIVVVSAFELAVRNKPSAPVLFFSSQTKSLFFRVGIVSTAFGAFFAALLILNVFESGGMRAYFSNRIYFSQNLGYASGLALLFPIGALLAFFAIWDGARSKWRAYALFLLLAGYWALFCVSRGTRLQMFLLLGPPLIVWAAAYARRPLSALWRWGLIVLPVAFWASFAASYRRSVLTGAEVTVDTRSITSGLDGAFGNHENLVWLMYESPDPVGGATYVAALTNLIPRAIWPEKPLGGGPTLTNLIFPNSYEIGRFGNSSITPGLVPEAYMNFGPLGALIVAALFGIVLAKISNGLRGSRSMAAVVLYSLALFFLCILSVFSEFLGIFTMWVVMSVPCLAIVIADRRNRLRQ
ncbi:MAG: O-antigen polymerase [Hyphomonadaceae bacterium]